jgi:hypothetical protein
VGITQEISSRTEASSVGCAAVRVGIAFCSVRVCVWALHRKFRHALKPPLWEVQQCVWVLLFKVCVRVCICACVCVYVCVFVCGHYTGNSPCIQASSVGCAAVRVGIAF